MEVVKIKLLLAEMVLGQAEQHITLSVHMYSSLYYTVLLHSASLASEEVSLTVFEKQGTYIYTQIDR